MIFQIRQREVVALKVTEVRAMVILTLTGGMELEQALAGPSPTPLSMECYYGSTSCRVTSRPHAQLLYCDIIIGFLDT